MSVTKARSLETKWGVGYPANQDQWWQLNESGKLWELWEESTTVLLQCVAYLRASNVTWAEPWTPTNAHKELVRHE